MWLAGVEEVLGREGVRADHAATGLGVARALVSWVDAPSRTTRVTNAVIAARAGVCERTAQRWLRRFEAWGLLGLAAAGRSAAWAPRARVDDGAGGTVLVARNEAAVRSLCVPAGLVGTLTGPARGGRGEARGGGCGSRCHPYPWLGKIDPRTRARGGAGDGSEPLRGAEGFSGAASRPVAGPGPDRERAWHSPRATRSKDEGVLGLARRLQEELLVLRGCSDRYVMRVIRPFFDAGWGLSDLVGAVDRQPDGSPWPHSGARGVREPARWLIPRLSAWLDDEGAVLVAPSMRARAEHEAVLAARRREAAARAEQARRVEEQRRLAGGALRGQLLAAAMAAELSEAARRASTRRRAEQRAKRLAGRWGEDPWR